jgi:hypothetical protein
MCDIHWSPKEHALAVSFFGGNLPVVVFEYQKQALLLSPSLSLSPSAVDNSESGFKGSNATRRA